MKQVIYNDQAQLARQMVEQQIRARGIHDAELLEAMQRIPRHRFLPDLSPAEAYSDRALPTTEGQTISQPYMVALMTSLLRVRPGLKVLEIGTGSGYQTAILTALGARVVSIERSAPLAEFARRELTELGLDDQVEVHVGDGTLGWPEQAPYDRILVTAAAPDLPSPYQRQLADPGTIVIPIGGSIEQTLEVFHFEDGQWHRSSSVGCRFVPLIGAAGWPEDPRQID